MKKHYNITVHGKVQGVGFRFSCMEAAYKFGVRGFVKNNRDRSVYIEAEGENAAMDSFLEWCRRGPIWAKIRKVDEEEGDLVGYESFEIKR